MSQKLSTIIVDDESLARRGLKLCLAELEGIEVLASAATVAKPSQRFVSLNLI